MTSKNQKYWHVVQLKKFMKENGLIFIKNNERRRRQLRMNKKQLTNVLQYLNKTGYLEPRNESSSRNKIYKISRNLK